VRLTVVSPGTLKEHTWTHPVDLAARISGLPVSSPEHRAVVSTLREALPAVPFRLTHIVDSTIRTAYRITPLYFSGRSESDVTNYWQGLVDIVQECQGPAPPRTDDATAVYRLRHLEHVGQFVQRAAVVARYRYEKPTDFTPTGVINYQTTSAEVFRYTSLPELSNLQRWFQDWTQSSARATSVENYWRLQLREGVWKGKHYCDATPRSVSGGVLQKPSIAGTRKHAQLRTWLERFDDGAGYQMAWYFFMLANRITHHIGQRVHRSLCNGQLSLTEADSEAVRRWAARPYASQCASG
jgi:hypothetical protein